MEIGGRFTPKSHKVQIAILSSLLVVAAALVLWLLARHPQVSPVATNSTTTKSAKVQLALFASGLNSPTAVVSTGIGSDSRLFVLEQGGRVRIINGTGTLVSEPFLDISGLVTAKDEMGLLGMAFSPNYATDGYFYVDYTDKGGNTVVARYHVSKDANTADVTTAQVILTQQQPHPNHNGGQLAFGPDGYLYIGFGDGGNGGDPDNLGQNMSTWLGKILRIDVSKLPYSAPADNPYVATAGAKPEIWDAGLRNPWRFSFDSKTHDVYIADVGQGDVEEVNVEQAGKGGNNYGWRCYEGANDFKTDGCKGKDSYVFPAVTYDHSQGRCSVTGGYVYRGAQYPDLGGTYFYGDYCGGQLYTMTRSSDGSYSSALALQTPYKISTFGQDSGGELYLADYATGAIYQLQDAK